METEALYFNHLLSVLYTYVEKEEQGIELTKEELEDYINIVEELKDNNIQIPFGIET